MERTVENVLECEIIPPRIIPSKSRGDDQLPNQPIKHTREGMNMFFEHTPENLACKPENKNIVKFSVKKGCLGKCSAF